MKTVKDITLSIGAGAVYALVIMEALHLLIG